MKTLLDYQHPMLFKSRDIRNVRNESQVVYRFRNGYGASVINTGAGSGRYKKLYELAVIRFRSQEEESWDLCYETPITDDVITSLDSKEVAKILNRVGDLPPDAKALPGAMLDME